MARMGCMGAWDGTCGGDVGARGAFGPLALPCHAHCHAMRDRGGSHVFTSFFSGPNNAAKTETDTERALSGSLSAFPCIQVCCADTGAAGSASQA